MNMIHLSLPIQESKFKEISNDVIDVDVLLLYPFYVEADANGNSFDITKEKVRAIHDNYNKTVKFKWTKLQKIGKEIPLHQVELASNILDHDKKAMNVVGHVLGNLSILERNEEPYLFGKLRVKGRENVERVKDGRFSNVSIGFDHENLMLLEISWVVTGAIPGAQAIFSQKEDDKENTQNSDAKLTKYNTVNLANVKNVLLSKYDKNRLQIEDIEKEIEVTSMLTNLLADGKILPKDTLRIKSELSQIKDKEARFASFSLLAENLRDVVDYKTVCRNNLALNWEASLMERKSDKALDLEQIAQRSAILLKKGHKAKFDKTPVGEDYEEKEGDMSKQEKMSKKFSKKDMKHCLSLHDKDELGKYLASFLSKEEDEEEEDEEKDMKKDEKEKGKFSSEIKSLLTQCVELKKQNSEIIEKMAVLSKGNEESKALFSRIVELSTSDK